MKYKLLLLSALSILSISNINAFICINGTCPLNRKQIILAHRVINPADRIRIGYKINPRFITAIIHLPVRPNSWFTGVKRIKNTYISNWLNNSFDSNIKYGSDDLTFSVRDGKFVSIVDVDFNGRTHRINTQLPQPVRNLIHRVEVSMHGNTVEIKMPRV